MKRSIDGWRGLLFRAGMVICLTPTGASAQALLPGTSTFNRTETMVAVRDGVRLHTVIFTPKNAKENLPFILMRTPYGVDLSTPIREYTKDLAADGYIFVYQDIRGRYKSEGAFVMMRAPRDRADTRSIDEGTDTYDTIDWLVKTIPNNNGRVGMLGISYDGWLTAMAMIEPHPSLRAISPQASPADQFLGDDFHHNGAFRLSYGFEYVALMETGKVQNLFKFDQRDTFEWYLKLGSLANINPRYFHGTRPTWNDFLGHPTYDSFWQKQAFAPYLNKVTVPTLNVSGWWDQEDYYGALKIYELLEKHDDNNQNFLIIGPWNHGGWSGGSGESLGKIHFGSSTGKYYREKVQARWFAHYLKDKGELNFPEAQTFQTGSNRWQSYERWPPKKNITTRNLYMQPGGKLSFHPPESTADADFDSYLSDPARPVPYRPRPIEATYQGPGWFTWLVDDQRFVHLRPDVQSWETEPLKEDLIVAGDVIANLFASTSGTDSDWIVKLIDVYPDPNPAQKEMFGYQLMVANEVFRGRFHKSFEKPEALKANEVYPYAIDIHWMNHCFRKGHKLMVQVQSTWFPVIDRNPQKFVDNIYLAKESDYQAATQRIYRSPAHPSHLALPVWTEK